MTIKYKTLLRLGVVVALGFLPALVAGFFVPGWDRCFDYSLFALVALTVPLSVAHRAGWLRVVFSPSDRESKRYQMWRNAVENERLLFGRLFSPKYYENFELDAPPARHISKASNRE